MHFKTYLLVAVVLVLAMGMGCGSSGSTTSGSATGDYASTIVGTWTQVGNGVGTWPQTIVFNSNGTGSESYSSGYSQGFTFSLSGSQVTLNSGSTITLTSIGVTTFTMTSSQGTSPTYKRA